MQTFYNHAASFGFIKETCNLLLNDIQVEETARKMKENIVPTHLPVSRDGQITEVEIVTSGLNALGIQYGRMSESFIAFSNEHCYNTGHMGLTTVTLTITNPENKKALTEEFLVDSGAFYTVLPKRMVNKLGLKPNFKQAFSLADGTKITRPVGSAYITFQGKKTASPVVLGKNGDAALLGVLTLEALGLILDPFERKLHPAKLML